MNEPALIAWLRYNADCEDFDRTLPGYVLHGEWIPIFEAMTESRRFAARRRIEVMDEMRGRRIPFEEWRAAQLYVQSLSHDKVKELLEELAPRRRRPAIEKWPPQPRPDGEPSEDMKIANRMATYATK